VLHGVIGTIGAKASSAWLAQCDETTRLQENVTTTTCFATGLWVSAIAGVKVEYVEFDRTPSAKLDLFVRKGTIVPDPAVACGGEYCVAFRQTDREVVENGGRCGFGDTFTLLRP
jgi:hypothetical protein